MQTEAFKGLIAPWQKGYVSGWREAMAEDAADLAAMDAVKDEPSMPWDEFEKTLPAPTDYAALESRAVGHMAEQPAPETKAKTKRQPKAPKPPKRALSWVRINGELHPATPGQAICSCPSCGVTAKTHAEVAETFSIRYDKKDRTKPRPQSSCSTCRTKSARERRERDRAQLPVPGAV